MAFRKTKEEFGGLSNMAAGFPLIVNHAQIRTSEALYQACRFPHLPKIQRSIIDQKSPMSAKMVGKPYRGQSRSDWDQVRTKIMRWVLRVKLVQHWESFGGLLDRTGDLPIVEDSHKDSFWGAKPNPGGMLVGENVLGRLLMELRQKYRDDPTSFRIVEPLEISDFLLFGRRIEPVVGEIRDPLILTGSETQTSLFRY